LKKFKKEIFWYIIDIVKRWAKWKNQKDIVWLWKT
jgi:hypothetical protein